MGFYKYWVLGVGVALLTGCSTVEGQNKNVYEQGYRQGVKEQVQQVVAQFQGGNFPYYHWSAPIVQEVRIPAHLANGVMIPEHNELVIIQPGQWTISPAYPIQTQERNHYDNQILYMDMDVSNITALPAGVGRVGQSAERSPEEQDH
ncbi:MAG: hypothetical protein HY209_00035 [Candidatus Omnitrophica bacterium]|nr:hypothetical protein [Candidatus Omnitrophota bacterium]